MTCKSILSDEAILIIEGEQQWQSVTYSVQMISFLITTIKKHIYLNALSACIKFCFVNILLVPSYVSYK